MMGINFTDFSRIPTQQSGLGDIFANLLQGFKMQREPARMNREQQQQEMANALRKLQLEEEPERFKSVVQSESLQNALRQARIDQMKKEANLPFGGKMAPGGVGQAMWLDYIRGQKGEDSQLFKDSKKAYDADLSKTEFLNEYRQSLIGTADKRASTPLAKTEQEIEDVKAGFVPGTDRSQPIEDPRMQSEMLERLKLQRQKSISDVDSRKRALFASNIDKTLENIDVDHLTQYAGFKGGMSKAIQEGLAPLGKESKEYGKYQKALTGAKLLAKQVRQFYGDSITPEMQKGLQSITNPATWSNNPKIAKQNFNVVKNLLKKETGTYRGALKGTGEFQEQEESSELTFNPITGGFE